MNIGNVSEQSGLPAKTIRYYEDIGLVQPSRRENGYRDFTVQELHKLTFLGRARSLGFSIEECRTLLSLYEDHERSSADVKAIAQSHLARVDQKIEELQALSATLGDLVVRCHGDDRPDCPIMDDLTDSDLAETRNYPTGTTLGTLVN
ncbi:Cu(I)-responsive transcriptional regulator [Salipiger marinus]|jgi:Cu(I)-responsive transcriptional regulator|uniref:Transcriptional regulator n=1 Tax=Paracoccus isoporae TaxID=591205 RepID=A0A1G7FRM8_9RHOB|nr:MULTISPECIES: Cu(I)-responsive transcriptional regulator [Rhodobacterales]MEB3421774.1 Cu(I)-responsive transcriptional regulator [Salipiger manganoxidans]SDE78365.1 transcriptional regulator [Paracoccus isoporae]